MKILSGENAKDLIELAAPIIDYLKENDSITARKGIELMGKSKDSILRVFSKLIDFDVLEKKGSARSTVYCRK